MKEYHITLKNEKARWYTRISLIAILTNALIFLYYCFSSDNKKVIASCIICVALIAGCLLLNRYLKKIHAGWQLSHYMMFLVLAVEWNILGQYKLAIIPAIFGALSFITDRKLEVTIQKDQIAYPSFPLRNIRWADISNVILKDGLLTIDLKNNKLIQQFIDEQQSRVNEKEFNDFCNQQLTNSAAG